VKSGSVLRPPGMRALAPPYGRSGLLICDRMWRRPFVRPAGSLTLSRASISAEQARWTNLGRPKHTVKLAKVNRACGGFSSVIRSDARRGRVAYSAKRWHRALATCARPVEARALNPRIRAVDSTIGSLRPAISRWADLRLTTESSCGRQVTSPYRPSSVPCRESLSWRATFVCAAIWESLHHLARGR